MSTRTRSRSPQSSEEFYDETNTYEELFGLDPDISDDDIEAYLYEKEEATKQPGVWNLPTVAGLSIIGVGSAYLLQEMGLPIGFDLSALAQMLPWLAGILIILVGFGVLSWSPNRRKKRKRVKPTARQSRKERKAERVRAKEEKKEAGSLAKKRFVKSVTNRKIAGVCGGIGEFIGIDPTIVRIAFVVGAIFGGMSTVVLYLLLMFVMPDPSKEMTQLERELERAERKLDEIGDRMRAKRL